MPGAGSTDVTELLLRSRAGDGEAHERLLAVVYDELRRKAAAFLRRERVGHTLQPTALVHEVYLRLVDQDRVAWQSRAHFVAIAASMMRRVLVDHGRRQKAEKRGGAESRVMLGENVAASMPREIDLMALDEALEALAALDEPKARIVELRAFGGLDVDETAEVMGLSSATVKRHWSFALAWLKQRMDDEPSAAS